MSLNLRITLLLAVAPFLTFWGLQIGVGLADLLIGADAEPFIVAPAHFGWYVAALILVTANSARLWVFNWISDDQANN